MTSSFVLSEARLAATEHCLRAAGYAVIPHAGFAHGGRFDPVRAAAIAACFGTPSSRDGGHALCPVRVTSRNPRETFSRRAGAAPLHTDSAYHDQPEERFALFCVRPAVDGGRTRLLRASDALRGLAAPLRAALARPQWYWRQPPLFGDHRSGPARVLDEPGTIRWRRDTLEVPLALQTAADAFQDHLETNQWVQEVALTADTVLICDNQRVLHGRTSFADPGRWLVRVRLTWPCTGEQR